MLAEFSLEIAQLHCPVNDYQFDSGNFGEVFHVLSSDRISEPGVMHTCSINPCGAGGCKIGVDASTRRGTGSLGSGCSGFAGSTSLTMRRLPRSITERLIADPAGAPKTRRTGSSLPPILRRVHLQLRPAVGD